jgi:P-type conjugative transfer protein TrbJ
MQSGSNKRQNSSYRVNVVRCFAVALAVAGASTMANAQFLGPMPVIDATAITRLATQIRNQVQQLTVARNQLQLQIANMKKLGNPGWRTIASTLGQIDALTQQGIAIWYSLQAVDVEFQKTFPGWKLSSTMPADMRLQQERTLATLRSAVSTANITAQQLAVANARLTGMKGRIGSITSAQQAAELNGAIGIHTAEELTLLRQQLAAQGNAEAVYLANQVNRETQAAAAADAFRTAGATTPVRTKNMTVAAVGIP